MRRSADGRGPAMLGSVLTTGCSRAGASQVDDDDQASSSMVSENVQASAVP
jgi:hypothetical protein